MKADTFGFALRDTPTIVRDLREHDRVDMPRNNQRIIQAFRWLVQGWRANADIQLLLCNSHPDACVDAAEVARVTNHSVSCQCKGFETETEKRNELKNTIMQIKEETGDIADIKRLARKLLNQSAKNRIVS